MSTVNDQDAKRKRRCRDCFAANWCAITLTAAGEIYPLCFDCWERARLQAEASAHREH